MTETATEPTVRKRTSREVPYLSWCLVVRNCEKTLEATLRSIRDRTPEAEIVVVDTCSSDSTPEIAQRYADVFEVYRGPYGDWLAEDYAVDDMAVARQHSFELASGRWRAWADGDDRVVGAGTPEGRELLELNGRYKPGHRDASKVHDTGDKPMSLVDVLRWIEEHQPQTTCIWCPYLYQRDEHGHALQWQERERIVRWDDPPKFRWAEPAHEILVPIGDYRPPTADLPHLLFVHEKDFSPAAVEYSIKRHSAIMLNQYEEGDVTYRRCRYLAQFAQALWPARELEFLEAGLANAWTLNDRYRGLIALGNYHGRRGLYAESRAHHAAAAELVDHVPDAYYAAAQVAHDGEDWPRVVTQLRKGVACELSKVSEVVPRDHELRYPSMLALALQKCAAEAVAAGQQEHAAALLREAAGVAMQVRSRPVGKDRPEADGLFFKAHNAYLGQQAMLGLKALVDYLKANDEPEKLSLLTTAIPHNQENHPVVRSLELLVRKIERHKNDEQSYRDFYNDDKTTGYVSMPEEFYTYELSHPRVQWVADRVAEDADVLEVGSCDGIVGIPLVLKNTSAHYHAIDMNPSAIEAFKGLLARHDPKGWQDRVQLDVGTFPEEGSEYDVVIAAEIIEHVPYPPYWLGKLKEFMRPDGVMFLTTPWGSFDEGHPTPVTCYGTPRDERGHLRAYTVERLVEDLWFAGLKAVDVARVGTDGDGLVAQAMVAKAVHRRAQKTPVAVAVAGALWDWNGSVVDRDGIGASEEMIVRVGELVATERDYDVFGPVPESEVYKGVGYYERAAIRRVREGTKIVVSRSPGYWRVLDDMLPREHPMVLWLQDTTYPELSDAANWSRYERIVCVSEWHKTLTSEAYGIPPDRIAVAYNFLQPEHWLDRTAFSGWREKKADHFVYASSPDRGLIKLLKLWPKILERHPTATLSIFYGWKGCAKLGGGQDPAWNRRYLTMREQYETLRHQQGVTEVGLVNHYQLAHEFKKAGVWAYPTDFHETGCLTACKARAAGAVPVTSALAALKETAKCDESFMVNAISEQGEFGASYDDDFLDAIDMAIETPLAARQKMAHEAVERFGWPAIKPVWDEVLK